MSEATPLLESPVGRPKWIDQSTGEFGSHLADIDMHIEIKKVEFNDDDHSSLGDEDDTLKDKKKKPGIADNHQARSWISKIDKNAFQFALRMGVMLTFTSLFVLVRTPSFQYPAGMWVLVSTLFVCWFPALDAASVIEKYVVILEMLEWF
jgi:hypothetical protein